MVSRRLLEQNGVDLSWAKCRSKCWLKNDTRGSIADRSRAPSRVGRVNRAQQEIDESFNHYSRHSTVIPPLCGTRQSQHPVAASLFPLLYNPSVTIFINVTDLVDARRYFTEQKTPLHTYVHIPASATMI